MYNPVTIFIGFLLILGVGGIAYWQISDISKPEILESTANAEANSDTDLTSESEIEDEDEDEDEDDDVAASAVSAGTGTVVGSSLASYSAADVAQHNSRGSCWSSINGGVYDLTSWIPRHSGGEEQILKLCGMDGSSAFNKQHGGAKLQARILSGFKIGTLQQ